MLLLYNVLIVVLAPLWVAWMVLRARKRAQPVDWTQRQGAYGFSLPRSGRRVWIHAVSVGELMAARPVLEELRRAEPPVEIVLSTTTSSGHSTAQSRLEGLFDRLVYFPIDVPRFCLNALVSVKPSVVVLMETEVWPNFLWVASRMGIPAVLANARLSDRSYRWRALLGLVYRPALRMVEAVLAQSETDARRFASLGARTTEVVGNTKFDTAAAAAEGDAGRWRRELGLPDGLPVIVVGSTRSEMEERLVAAALGRPGLPGFALVWAPRHVERAPEVAARLREVGREPALRSEGGTGATVVLDTYGELAGVYAAADVVVVGGGFDDLGGQDILQPMAHGKPVIHGPSMHNFRDVARLAREAGATTVAAPDPEPLAHELGRLLADPGAREAMGAAGRALVVEHAGASARIAARIVGMLG